MPLKKLAGLLHRWLGLGSGLVVFIVSITGAIYAFEAQLSPLIYKSRTYVPTANTAPLPLSQLLQIARDTLKNTGCQVNRLQIGSQPDAAYRFGAYAFNPRAITYFGQVTCRYNVTVNPYTGKVLYVENTKYEFFTVVEFIHYNLLLGELGRQIVGWSTFIFLVMLITGIILWFPKNKPALRQRLKFKWTGKTKWKRKNYDLHNILGFYSMIVVFILAVTGLVWAFGWVNKSIRYIVNGAISEQPAKQYFSDTTNAATTISPDTILFSARIKVPGANSFFIVLPSGKTDTYYASAGTDEHLTYNNQVLLFDQYTGRLLKQQRFENKSNGDKMYALNYDIHRGTILGIPGITIAFLGSLIAASLPVTGFLIWWGRWRKS